MRYDFMRRRRKRIHRGSVTAAHLQRAAPKMGVSWVRPAHYCGAGQSVNHLLQVSWVSWDLPVKCCSIMRHQRCSGNGVLHKDEDIQDANHPN